MIEPDIGAVVDRRYLLLRLVARGGMGSVFEAQHRYTRRSVAIKLLGATSIHKEAHRERLLREAHALASVKHPGFVEVIDAGICDENGPFVVLEMLEGRPLDGILASRRRLTVSSAVTIGRRICEALSFAHARGVVHRDVKPTNIFIARNDIGVETVKLLDLGIASMDEAAASLNDRKLTGVDELLGTPEYMAPEQIFGQSVDHRCDIYATAITLYECLTGSVPYVGTYPQVLLQIGTATHPPSIRASCPEVSEALAEAIEHGLAKDPAERYQTATVFARALAEAIDSADPPLTLLINGGVAERSTPPEEPFIVSEASISPPPLTKPTPSRPEGRAVPPPLPAAARQRVFARAPYVTPVVILANSGATDARSEDVSVGGLLVMAARGLPSGENVRVRFALPATGTATGVVTVAAVVCWARPARGKTAIGLEFIDPPADLRAALQAYVSSSTATTP